MTLLITLRNLAVVLVCAAATALAQQPSAPPLEQPKPQAPPQAQPAPPQKPSTPAQPGPAAPAQPGQPPPGQAAGAPPPPAPPAYSYDPQGRRDPFISLLARGTDPKSMLNRPPGPAGLLIGEVTVKGIVRDRSGFIAMIQGPDTKTFIVRPGEKLMDGTVKSITADTVVFLQDVTDPLSLVKQRELRKSVRPMDGGRG